MTGYHVTIPSYRRPESLATRTLTTLLNGNVPPEHITVYIHDSDPHADAYRDVTTALGTRLEATPARGLLAQRNLIFQAQPPGTRTVTMDDDINEVATLTDDGTTLRPQRDLHNYFRRMFQQTTDHDLTAWGVGPVPNAFFMSDKRTTDLKFCIFQLAGFIRTPGHPAEHLTVGNKDDYEHSLLRWWYDGGILRDNATACRSAVYSGTGGLQHGDQRSHDATEQDVQTLLTNWPEQVRRNTRRKSDRPEILLARRASHRGHDWGAPPPGLAP